MALHLALHVLGLGPGDEVIVPSFTYIASVNAIAQTGATPVFADSRRSDWLLDVGDVERRITRRTKVILPVHLYGHACDMPALQALAARHGIAIIEDAAEALGTTLSGEHVGTFGDVGTFSFFGNKKFMIGEGGMAITDNADLARRLRQYEGAGSITYQAVLARDTRVPHSPDYQYCRQQSARHRWNDSRPFSNASRPSQRSIARSRHPTPSSSSRLSRIW